MEMNVPDEPPSSQKRKREEDNPTAQNVSRANEEFTKMIERSKLRNERLFEERIEEIKKRTKAFEAELIKRCRFDVNDYQTDLYYNTFEGLLGDDTFQEVVDDLVVKYFKPEEVSDSDLDAKDRFLQSVGRGFSNALNSFHATMEDYVENFAREFDFEEKDEFDALKELLNHPTFQEELKSQWELSLECLQEMS
jgi:hypothetical protein